MAMSSNFGNMNVWDFISYDYLEQTLLFCTHEILAFPHILIHNGIIRSIFYNMVMIYGRIVVQVCSSYIHVDEGFVKRLFGQSMYM